MKQLKIKTERFQIPKAKAKSKATSLYSQGAANKSKANPSRRINKNTYRG